MTADEIRARWADIGPWNDADHPVDEIYAAHFPRETAAVIAAPTDIDYLLKENERLRTVLEQIANPIGYLQAEAVKEGAKLDGAMAVLIESTASWYREHARKALLAQPDNAIPTQSERNSDAIATEEE